MDITILDTDLNAVCVIDTYESIIWIDRYQEYGDFEIYTFADSEILSQMQQGYYLQCPYSDHMMIIEKTLIETDAENGNRLTVTGRSLESILTRRIIWGQKTISGNFQNGVKELLEECIIAPVNKDRKIDNFVFEASTDPSVTKLVIDTQYTGDNLYDVIKQACVERNVGFSITLDEKNRFVFRLYVGKDRSYNQSDNPYVTFSPDFENVINSNYLESKSALKTVALVGGEGEGASRRYTTVGSGLGMERREFFVDARDISSDIEDGGKLTDDEYMDKLQQRGKEKLAENTDTVSFEGEIDTTFMYKLGKDFFCGDIVQFSNEYGHETPARIIEMVISEDERGFSMYPTLKMTKEDDG